MSVPLYKQMNGKIDLKHLRHAVAAAGCLRACGEAWSLGDTQQDARTKNSAESARECSHGGKERPEERADTIDVGDAETIEDHAGRNLQQRVGPEEATEEPTQLSVGQIEFVLKLRSGYGEIDPIEIIDQDAYTEQESDTPA